jgi:5'-nucleotidase
MAGNGKAFSGTKIETYSGGWLDLWNPRREDLRHGDIALGLSRVCRFAGQSRWFYSVAEHSVLVARLAKKISDDRNAARYALVHDASEAYIGDVSAPLKTVMRLEGGSPYDDVAEKLTAVILDYYGLNKDSEFWEIVDRADKWAFVIEAKTLLPSKLTNGYEIPDYIMDLGDLPEGIPAPAALSPSKAQVAWIREW